MAVSVDDGLYPDLETLSGLRSVAGLESEMEGLERRLGTCEAVRIRGEGQIAAMRAEKERLEDDKLELRREIERPQHDLGHALGRIKAMECTQAGNVIH